MESALTLESLPLFPLGTVLFPGGVLPLRIFEVRYLDMIGKCHRHGAPFGVVALTRGSEVQRAPQDGPTGEAYADEGFYPVGTLATITALNKPQPGLMEIRCVGTQRFTVTRQEKLRHGLWIGDVQQMSADPAAAVPPDLEPVSRALGNLIDQLRQRGVPERELPMQAPFQLQDCGWVANRWCELLGLPLEMQQRLMALDNPLVRLELVGDILQRQGIGI
ncbi:MAG: LON peptidase substrate-binding domain-containing protein [Burkholderiaceae bacterium]|nr:LON peptidase substrate-binding domain-containing protein [Rhodoferax sp.]MCP5264230.1 LON peptidase substrate-binding domain-containing protein [Rhodoferax sp.]MCW5631591.1 LON peptidase substrate-binding domain-containing protein [Rhodoferax sp.]